jgi:hypothetical protein
VFDGTRDRANVHDFAVVDKRISLCCHII